MSIVLLPIVVYLCRYQDNDSAGKFSRFIESYKKYPAGCEHFLIIIRKGFEHHESEWSKWCIQLEEISYELRSYPDERYCFGYQRLIIEDHPDQYILFCTASTEILVDNWLALFMRHARNNRILGHCGSFQSMYSDSVKRRNKLRLRIGKPKCFPSSVLSAHNNLLKNYCLTRCPYPHNWTLFSSIKHMLKDLLRFLFCIKGKWDMFCNSTNFYPFPNPVLRTSAFMIPPRILESIYYWPDVMSLSSKNQEFLFESGKYSLSIQALIAGYELLVVGADGKAYSMTEWQNSKTYRSFNQENLVIADHHTRCYEVASITGKRIFEEDVYGKGDVDITSFLEQIAHLDLSEVSDFFNRSF
jgi:hypothetical protein